MMYFWAAWDKSSLAFGERIEHVYTRLYFGTYEPGAWFSPLMHIGAYGAVLLEYLLPFVLWFSYGRRVFLPVAIAFHLVIYYTLTVGTYTVTMYVLFLLFLPPETIHRIVDTMTARDEKSSH